MVSARSYNRVYIQGVCARSSIGNATDHLSFAINVPVLNSDNNDVVLSGEPLTRINRVAYTAYGRTNSNMGATAK